MEIFNDLKYKRHNLMKIWKYFNDLKYKRHNFSIYYKLGNVNKCKIYNLVKISKYFMIWTKRHNYYKKSNVFIEWKINCVLVYALSSIIKFN